MIKSKVISHVLGAVMALLASECFAESQTVTLSSLPLSNHTLNACVYPVGAPFVYLDNKLTKPYGVDVDIIIELQKRLGFSLQEDKIFTVANMEEGYQQINQGQIDIFAGALSIIKDRVDDYDFTPIYFSTSLTVLYSPRLHPQIHSERDIAHLKIAYHEETAIQGLLEDLNAVVVPVKNLFQAFYDVSQGTLDGLVYDRPSLMEFVRAVPSAGLAVTPHPFGVEHCRYALLLPKDSPYKELISQTMYDMINDGTIDAILLKWGVLKY